MKYSVHDSQEEALAENERLMGLLGIPNNQGTSSYSIAEEKDGKWVLPIAAEGTWKADHLALNIQELPEDNSWINAIEEILG